jgi:hypothetical protein
MLLVSSFVKSSAMLKFCLSLCSKIFIYASHIMKKVQLKKEERKSQRKKEKKL